LERIWDFSLAGIRRTVEDSLTRLGLDHLDVAFLHDPEHHPQSALAQGVPALAQLKAEGLVDAIGLGSMDCAVISRFVREADLDLVMMAGRYTLLEQPALADALPACAQRGVTVVNAGVFNSGILATDRLDPDARYDYLPVSPALLAKATAIADCCHRHRTSLRAAALAFAAAPKAISTIVWGADRPEQVLQNVSDGQAAIPAELWAELAELDLIPPDADLP
jgi:D-threo-aldose 1-dehydrogenase